MRTAVKKTLKYLLTNCSTEQQLPSDMLEKFLFPPYQNIFVDSLQNSMREINKVAPSANGLTQLYIDPALRPRARVFWRIDRIKSPLCQLYTGLHKVSKIRLFKKHFLNGLKSTVSIDRVKPALLLEKTTFQIYM
ncbi:integrase catalytic domain-containing protein [Nephila pilipes]|uniref:Integrase catalytic domain-containing protein n=1 Tax=Nephila pilipes TaxID=299642 RepID=A0A8X6MGJ8_NEPPI|nr:integrase catalytic domain-containing protein [Nephila pilipes]